MIILVPLSFSLGTGTGIFLTTGTFLRTGVGTGKGLCTGTLLTTGVCTWWISLYSTKF